MILEFEHTNTNVPIKLFDTAVDGWFYMEAQKSNVLVLKSGTLIPVKETIEDIESKLQRRIEECQNNNNSQT